MLRPFKAIFLILILTSCLSFLVTPFYLLALPPPPPRKDNNPPPQPPQNKTNIEKFFPPLTNTNNPTEPYPTGAVAADRPECSSMGVEILQKGGNAFDAAITTGLCQGIYSGFASGIGGGAAILIRTKDGVVKHIDGREKAPQAASRDMYVGQLFKAKRGGLAAGVPGELLAFYEMFQRYGSKAVSWKSLVKPVADLARNGFLVNGLIQSRIESAHTHDRNHTQYTEFWSIFGKPDGSVKKIGDTVVMYKLADTLDLISEANGVWSFYNGSLAEDIVADLEDAGGIITKADLSEYNVVVREPIETWYHGYQPPISGGACISLALNILEAYDLAELWRRGDYPLVMHWFVEALKFAYADRFSLGDPLFVENITYYLEKMSSKEHAAYLRRRINPYQTYGPDHYVDLVSLSGQEEHGTSHWVAVDVLGNAASITSTVNLNYGSLVVGKRTGILFNDQMDDFSTPGTENEFHFPPSINNFIAPGKRPLSSMSPTIVTKDNRLVFVGGGSGGSRIISGTLQVLIDILDLKLSANQAVSIPRIHHQLLPDKLDYEFDVSTEVLKKLNQDGHTFSKKEYIGNVEQVAVIENGKIWAASDWRKGGAPDGY